MTSWDERAAVASRVLVDTYWDERRALFRVEPARRLSWRTVTWHYWWQAHALDALVLAGDIDRADRLVGGILRRNRGITNNYYDDMAWLGLALYGLRGAGGRADADGLVAELMASLRTGVDPAYHAIVWRRGDTYLNVPANAPTAILAARTGDGAFARRLTTWLHATLVAPDGVVYDGWHPGGRHPGGGHSGGGHSGGGYPGGAVDTAEWTYNYGTVIGADVALGELDRASRVARAATRLVRPDGVLPDEGSGDRALFKGILARHLGALLAAAPDESLRDLLVHNAEAAWQSRSPDGLVGPDWARPPDRPVELSAHLSGVLLLHTVAAVIK
jgi:predicted alpha-1,6-mannanase (GH76 family)